MSKTTEQCPHQKDCANFAPKKPSGYDIGKISLRNIQKLLAYDDLVAEIAELKTQLREYQAKQTGTGA
nr:hypothetical protein [uncultured Desulfuromonas sp.]